MKDETYAFVEDVTQRKQTARSARNRRTHNGKGGRVKLPSDYMTRKELNAMNGEVKSYRLNDPMTWEEFKSMPDDIKETYIKLIREKFNVPDSEIAEMFGVHRVSMAQEVARLGIGLGKGKGGKRIYDRESWLAWRNGVPSVKVYEREAAEENPDKQDPVQDKVFIIQKAIPCAGSMTFKGKATDALKTVLDVLGEENVNITISWEVVTEN